MRNLLILVAALLAAFLIFQYGQGYALKERAKKHGADCVLQVGLTEDCELGLWVKRELQAGKCTTVRVVK